MVYSCFFLNVSNVCVCTETESRNYCTNRHGLIYQVINRWDMGGGGGGGGVHQLWGITI